jgi:hypothetical protein
LSSLSLLAAAAVAGGAPATPRANSPTRGRRPERVAHRPDRIAQRCAIGARPPPASRRQPRAALLVRPLQSSPRTRRRREEEEIAMNSKKQRTSDGKPAGKQLTLKTTTVRTLRTADLTGAAGGCSGWDVDEKPARR